MTLTTEVMTCTCLYVEAMQEHKTHTILMGKLTKLITSKRDNPFRAIPHLAIPHLCITTHNGQDTCKIS
jgi:hypothetical protein